MFIVLKSFTNGIITASKNKVIKVKDKKISDTLLKAGVIAPYSKEEQTSAEKDKKIVNLNKTIADMQAIIDTLTVENTDLKAKLEEKTSDLAPDSSDGEEDNETGNSEKTKDNDADDNVKPNENNDNLDKKDDKKHQKDK